MRATLPWPPTINNCWRRGRNGTVHCSNEVVLFRREVARRIGPWKKPLKGRLKVAIMAYPPDNRRRDLDNILKSLLDSLQLAGVFLDDSQIDELWIERGRRKGSGEVDITVDEIG